MVLLPLRHLKAQTTGQVLMVRTSNLSSTQEAGAGGSGFLEKPSYRTRFGVGVPDNKTARDQMLVRRLTPVTLSVCGLGR